MEFIIVIFLLVSYYGLRMLILGKLKGNKWEDMDEAGLDVRMYGNIILMIVWVIAIVSIVLIYGWESVSMKLFWLIFVSLVLGFQLFIDWRYKNDKSYIVSLIILVIGVTLFSLLFIFS